jgi:hypothetical protein
MHHCHRRPKHPVGRIDKQKRIEEWLLQTLLAVRGDGVLEELDDFLEAGTGVSKKMATSSSESMNSLEIRWRLP